MESRRNKKIYTSVGAFGVLVGVILLIVLIVNYAGNTSVEAGTVSIEIPQANAKVFIDNTRETAKANAGEQIVFDDLSQGLHSFLVSKENYWPWKKEVTLSEDRGISLHPFLIKKKLETEDIAPESEIFQETQNSIDESTLPTASSTLLSDNQNTEIWIENNSIKARWSGDQEDAPYYFCKKEASSEDITGAEETAATSTGTSSTSSTSTEKQTEPTCNTITVLSPEAEITDIAFYKNNDQALVFSNGTRIGVVDINPEGTQNFHPVYEGQDVRFSLQDGTTLYVEDGDSLVRITL